MNMEKLPTAEELLEKLANAPTGSIEDLMIEFAKLHVEAALKEASEIVTRASGVNDFEESILNSYPLDNIK